MANILRSCCIPSLHLSRIISGWPGDNWGSRTAGSKVLQQRNRMVHQSARQHCVIWTAYKNDRIVLSAVGEYVWL